MRIVEHIRGAAEPSDWTRIFWSVPGRSVGDAAGPRRAFHSGRAGERQADRLSQRGYRLGLAALFQVRHGEPLGRGKRRDLDQGQPGMGAGHPLRLAQRVPVVFPNAVGIKPIVGPGGRQADPVGEHHHPDAAGGLRLCGLGAVAEVPAAAHRPGAGGDARQLGRGGRRGVRTPRTVPAVAGHLAGEVATAAHGMPSRAGWPPVRCRHSDEPVIVPFDSAS